LRGELGWSEEIYEDEEAPVGLAEKTKNVLEDRGREAWMERKRASLSSDWLGFSRY